MVEFCFFWIFYWYLSVLLLFRYLEVEERNVYLVLWQGVMFVFVRMKEKRNYILMESLLLIFTEYKEVMTINLKVVVQSFSGSIEVVDILSLIVIMFFVQDMECVIMLLEKFWFLNYIFLVFWMDLLIVN